MIKKQLIDNKYSEEERDFAYKLLIKIIKTELCLVVRDGLDEWMAPEGCNHAEPSMAGFPNGKCTVITTSRPWKLVDERIKNSQIDMLLEIEGINNPKTFIETIIRCIIDEKMDLEETLSEFQTFVSEYQLHFLSYSPMLYTLVICTWVDKVQHEAHMQGSSLCALYTTLLESLCRKANDTIDFFFKSNFMCFSNTKYLKPSIENVDAISKAAFHLLFSPETETSIVFDDKILSEYVSLSEKEFCLRAGLISKRKNTHISTASISFIHLSIQEFLAAYYIARNTNLIYDKISKYLNRYEDADLDKDAYLDMYWVFIFLCGLDISAAKKLSDIIDAHTVADGSQSSFDREFDDSFDYKLYVDGDTPFQNVILAGYREAVANGNVDIRLKLSHFCFRKDFEIREFRELHNLWRNNKSNALSLFVWENMAKIYSDGETSSTSDEASFESGKSVSHTEFDLSSCQQLQSLILIGDGIWMTDSVSLATSECPVWIVLNSSDQAPCPAPSQVLPSIKYILLAEITCSSTMIHTLFSTLITSGQELQCTVTRCKIRSFSEKEDRKLYITTDVTIVSALNNTFSLFEIQSTVPGLWEAFRGFNINELNLIVSDGETIEDQDGLFSQLLSSLTQLETIYMCVSNESIGLCKSFNDLNIKSLHLTFWKGDVIFNHILSFSETLTSLTQLEELSFLLQDDSPGLWKAIQGLNIKSLSLDAVGKGFTVNNVESLSGALISLKQLKRLSIELDQDSFFMFDAIQDLSISSLSLVNMWECFIANCVESLSETLSSLTQLEHLSIRMNDDSPVLWQALYGLRIKSLSLCSARCTTMALVESFSELQSQLEYPSLMMINSGSGLLKALFGRNTERYFSVVENMKVNHVKYLSATLKSLKQLEHLSIVADECSSALWEALYGLHIKRFILGIDRKMLSTLDHVSLSKTLASLKHIEELIIIADEQIPSLWTAVDGLNINSLIMSSQEGNIKSLSKSLKSLTQLKALSILVIDDSPCMWKALYGLNIKSLSLSLVGHGVVVNHRESLSESLKSLEQLDKIQIEMNNDCPNLWEALHGLNIKRLYLAPCSGRLDVINAQSMAKSLASLTQLESLWIDGIEDYPGLWGALNGLAVKRLRLCYSSGGLQVIHTESFSQSLSSLTQLDMLAIGLDNESLNLLEALCGLNINSLCLNLRYGLTEVQSISLSQCLSSLEHLEMLRIEVNVDSPGLWEALHGLQIKNLHIGTEFGYFEVNHVSCLLTTLSSLNKLEHISVNLENDLPGLWEVLFGLNIKSIKMCKNRKNENSTQLTTLPNALTVNLKYYRSGYVEAPCCLNVKSLSLRLSCGLESTKVYQISTLKQLLSFLTALDVLSITADMDSAELWESLRGLNIKSLNLSGKQGGLKVEYADLCTQSLSSLKHLETLSIKVDGNISGLWDSLRSSKLRILNIERLKLDVDHESSLSTSLASLTQLERLDMYANTYSDIHIPQSLKDVTLCYARLSPRELRELLNTIIELNHRVECTLNFGCSSRTDEYHTIKQELDALTHVEVKTFRVNEFSHDTHIANMEYGITLLILINGAKDPASTTSILSLEKEHA